MRFRFQMRHAKFNLLVVLCGAVRLAGDLRVRASRKFRVLGVVGLSAGLVATTFPVTKTDDTDDGTCDADCSLREAIEAANATPGADDVTVPAGTYLLTIGQLAVSETVVITGSGRANTIIDANYVDRVIDIETSCGAVSIRGVRIQSGYADDGGGIQNSCNLSLIDSTVTDNFAGWDTPFGGGIANFGGNLTLTNTTVSGNRVDGGNYYAFGGGIANVGGNVVLIGSTVRSNRAHGEYYTVFGGGIWNAQGEMALIDSVVNFNTANSGYYGSIGGGIANSRSLTLTNSTVGSNFAERGGGVAGLYPGSVTLTESTVVANHAEYGGRIWNFGGSMTLDKSAVLTNDAQRVGGGIIGSDLTIENSTVSGNTAFRAGGGLSAHDSTLANSTVSANRAEVTAGGVEGFNLAISSTVIADNSRGNCTGSVYSLGYNLTDDNSCGFAEPGDLVVGNAMLGPLADNGGPTQTRALMPGSPAIDAGGRDCPPPATDQRGVPRPQGAACDIGAYELERAAAIRVEIDIKPGSNSNPINASGRGGIPVAILGSHTFDVADVNVATLAVGPKAAAPTHDLGHPDVLTDHLQDANGDGWADLVAHFRTQRTGIAADDREACMTGATIDGTPFEGCDAIRVVAGRRGFLR